MATSFASNLRSALSWSSRKSVMLFEQDVPRRLLAEALKNAREEPVRRRALPPGVVIWLVIGMSLFRDRCIRAVVAMLRLKAKGHHTVSNSAIVQARDRLGEAPVAALCAYTADEWALRSAENHRWRGLSLFGVDGTGLRVADTVENEAAFGRPMHAKQRGQSGYPQVRLAVLMALRSHLLLGASFGPFRVGECTLAKKLWYLLPDQSLTVVDRGFVDYALFHQIMTSGAERHFLCRAKKNSKWSVQKKIGRHDAWVAIELPRRVRRKDPTLPETLSLRVIRYHRRGFQPQAMSR